ncbi:toxin-antitoxin system YwqK family antitoxin [Aestuariivivens sediminis]|uniref:toxin-antitoxin system YwqK family antitoxin n=1 Tax=Aestuariivivens sediminis TaxID=2913557 RepID=UPI001F5A122C|nr:hypothetical protein [Aestuariivivens sediminis]
MKIEKKFYSNQQLKEIGCLIDDRKDGEWKYYHENGNLSAIGQYSEKIICTCGHISQWQRRVGIWKIFHQNGILKEVGEYNKGFKKGNWKEYSEKGQILSYGNFLQGEENGDWKYYFDNGQLEKEGAYECGFEIGEWKTYHRNGQIKELGLYSKKHNKIGEWKYYFDNGHLEKTGKYTNGLGPVLYIDFNEFDGKKEYQMVGSKYSTKMIGEWNFFYKNGALKEKGNYIVDNKEKGPLDKKDGEWVLYHKNSKIHQIQLWDSGRLMDIICCFDSNGKNLDKGSIVNGNGSLKLYDENNKLYRLEEYVGGYENFRKSKNI